MHPIHRLPKLEKFLLLTAIFSGLAAVFVISAQLITGPVNQFPQAGSPYDTVRAWNFDIGRENWNTNNTREAFVENGNLNIRLGNQSTNSLIFNRQALAKLTAPQKFLTFKVSFQKLPPKILPTTASTSALTNVDLQIVNLPAENSAIKPTGIPDNNQASISGEGVVCAADVMTCPDGSYVPRIPPNCKFKACPLTAAPAFAFNVYYKKLERSAWLGPIPVTGKITTDSVEYFAKIPEAQTTTIEALRIDLSEGLSENDIVQFDSIALVQEKPLAGTVYPTYSVPVKNPIPTRNLTPRPTFPQTTPVACITPPPCYYGVPDGNGNNVYCLPKLQPGYEYCNTLSVTPMPKPTYAYLSGTPTACVPYPDGCITWKEGQAVLTCQFFRAENWCPLPTCTPRPACLDSIPRCMIAETPDMCPAGYSTPPPIN